MGKVSGMIYSSIYLVVCAAVLAVASGSIMLAYGLLGLAAVTLILLCAFGERLDGLCKEANVGYVTSLTKAPRQQPVAQQRREKPRREAPAWREPLEAEECTNVGEPRAGCPQAGERRSTTRGKMSV